MSWFMKRCESYAGGMLKELFFWKSPGCQEDVTVFQEVIRSSRIYGWQ